MPGHVFVVHGDLLKISADVLLIPCDGTGNVMRHWKPYGPHPDEQQLAAQLRDSRVSSRANVGGHLLRYVNTGTHPSIAAADWLKEGISDALRATAEDVDVLPDHSRRARRLIAMPLFGVGAGGFDEIRGEAPRAQLDAARDVAATAEVDIAIVCLQRSDFAAIQRQRSSDEWNLPADLRTHATSLAAAIRAGRLVLFLGAGVSAHRCVIHAEMPYVNGELRGGEVWTVCRVRPS